MYVFAINSNWLISNEWWNSILLKFINLIYIYIYIFGSCEFSSGVCKQEDSLLCVCFQK